MKCYLQKKTCNKDEDLHEIVGASLLQWTIDEILPQLIEKVEGEHDKNIKVAKLLYYIVVAEFIMAIRMETNPVFESLHKLVDGIIDADRLDYIVRDSYNSGVDWGKIPYKRLINSSKLVALDDDYFVIAFAQKALDEITDLLLLRYKIYARINFHHGCVKSTITLQASVYKLAKNLLENKSAKNVINSEIELLWKALGRGAGDNKLRIIQWNDSWLISVLHSALVKLHDDKNLKDKNRELLENLEEFLLNKKRFYTLLKRGDDWKRFVDQVFLYADITDERLEELKNRECKKFIESDLCTEEVLDVPKHDAHDSLNRIEALKKIKRTGELEYLYYVLPIGNDNIEIEQILGNTLEGMLEEKKIVDYRMVENKGRGKTGLPSHKDKYNEIYFYDNKGDFHSERLENLEEQIEVLRRSIPWFYIYFVPCDNCKNINQLSDELFHVLAKSVANMLIRRYNELFPNNTIE